MNKGDKKQMKISASLDCANYLSMKEDIKILEKSKVDSLHVDIIDGIFAPSFGISMGLLKQLKDITDLPIEVHLMVKDPSSQIELINLPHITTISFHIESVTRPYHLINQIKNIGKRVGIAINPSTPIEYIENLIPYIDTLIIMTVDPGLPGQRIIPEAFHKINKLSKYPEYEKLDIQVDGAIGYKEIEYLKDTIVSTIVAGTSALFRKEEPLEKSAKRLVEICKLVAAN